MTTAPYPVPADGDFLTFLAVERHVSASTQNQAFSALLFLYRELLQIELISRSSSVWPKSGDCSAICRADPCASSPD